MLLKTWGNIKQKTRQEIKRRHRRSGKTPQILVSQASASTIANKGDNTNPNLLTARPPRTHNTDALVIKLNLLREKSGFLSCCIQEKLVTKGLELGLEPTIGNYDQVVIDNWYSNLRDFLFTLMKQISIL